MATGIELAKAYVQIVPSAQGIQGELNKAMSGAGEEAGEKGGKGLTKGIGSAVGGLAKATVAGMAAAAGGMAAFATSSVKAGKEFDAAMSQVAATMGVTVDDIGELRDFAQQMGSTTAFSATQAAEALNYMALAGYDAETSMSMLPNVLNLAAAGGLDLAYASDMVTDASSALGLSIDDTSVMIDQMAKASSKTNTSVGQLGEAILRIGGTAKGVAGGTEELSTVLGVMADNGIKGAEAGTHLRNIMLALTPKSEDAATAMERIGLNAYNAEGELRPLQDVFLDMQASMEGMSTLEKQQILTAIFNKTDLASINALLATTSDRWEELGVALNDTKGAASAMAETQLDNLAGDVTLFQSALEGAKIAVSDNLTPSLREFVSFGSEGLSSITEAIKNGGLEGGVEELSKFLSKGVQMIIKKLPEFLKIGAKLFSGIVDGISLALPQLTGQLPTLFQSFSRIFLQIVKMIVDNLPIAAKQISMALPVILPEILSGLSSVILQLADNLPEILQPILQMIPQIIPQIINAAVQLFTALVEHLPEILQVLIDALPGILITLIDTLLSNLPVIIEGIVQLVVAIVEKLPEILAAIWEVIVHVWTTWVEPMLENLGRFLSDAWDKIVGVFQELGTWFDENVIQPIVGFFEGLWESVSGFFQGLWDDIVGIWESVSGWFDEHVIQPIAGFFTGLWDTVKEKWEGAKTFFTNLWDGIKQIFKTAINGIIDILNGMIRGLNILLTPLRAVIMAVGNLFGAGWTMDQVQIPEIPHLATGGIITGPTLAMLGENFNDEAVMPLENNTGWIRRLAYDITAEGGMTGGDELLDAVENIEKRLNNLQVVLDGDKVVGGISGRMDRALGNYEGLQRRGVATA